MKEILPSSYGLQGHCGLVPASRKGEIRRTRTEDSFGPGLALEPSGSLAFHGTKAQGHV